MAAKVDELGPYLIREVEGLGESSKSEEAQIGSGAYGHVFKVNINGVERIAKKLHKTFVKKVSAREKKAITSKFRAECIILSKLRHPNIVQFVGVHYGRGGMTDLTLFMEFLSSDLDKFLSTHPNLPPPLKLSILRDISSGLVYLHCEPPIVHRDLTARNILISDRHQAKIADLGMAKLVDIQAQLVSSHTQVPGQMFYMPPEALKEKASCTPKLDIFSFGHLALYTVTQKPPEVHDITDSWTVRMKQEGITQRLKRRKSLAEVGEGHCLYPIITECLFDNPDQRPTARDLNYRLCLLANPTPEVDCEEVKKLKKRISELEEANEHLEQQLISSERQQREDKKKDEKRLYEANETIQDLQQNLVRQKEYIETFIQRLRDSERVQEDTERSLEDTKIALQDTEKALHDSQGALHDSQRVTAELSTEIDEQKEEMEQLKKEKNEILDDMEAHKLAAATYAEDFYQERRDRERAHSKIADMETKYAKHFKKLTDELKALKQRADPMATSYEANYEAQMVASLREEKKRLEEDLQAKSVQMKHFDKQFLQKKDEMAAFEEKLEAQKKQVIDAPYINIRDARLLSATDDAMSRASPTTTTTTTAAAYAHGNPFQDDPDYIASGEADQVLDPEVYIRRQQQTHQQHRQQETDDTQTTSSQRPHSFNETSVPTPHNEQLQYQPLRPETPDYQYPIHYDQDLELHNSNTVQLEQKPYDPNLVCHVCGKRYHIGEIQEFWAHMREWHSDADDYMYK